MELITLLIVLSPLMGFFLTSIIKKDGDASKNWIALIPVSAVVLSFILTIYTWLNFTGAPKTYTIFRWFAIDRVDIDFGFLIDQLSLIMCAVITGIGSLIHIYSLGYMKEDKAFVRFMSYLNLFVFFMLVLVTASNFVLTFVGWEGVGLCSYLLIGFWFQNQAYNDAAKKAFIMNRIGDLGLLIAIFLLFTNLGTVDYLSIKNQLSTSVGMENTLFIISLCIFIGATGKSAQAPLFTWLPDAMAGPTPVSALIHAATMVTAGIYLIIRNSVLFELAPYTSEIITVVGITTALFAAFIGLKQNDIKKVLAYSTVSQLGYMFFALGLGAYEASFFHLLTHAFFKALLFLGAGSIIHAMGGEQDLRKMGGLKSHIKITHITFLIGTVAIAGLPPLAGFFSKDAILAAAFENSPALWVLGVFGACLTAFYMFRLYFLVFHTSFRGTQEQEHHLHESPLSMTFPLIVLAIFAVLAGFFNVPAIFGGQEHLNRWLSPVIKRVTEHTHHTSHTTEYILMAVSVGLVSMVIAYAYNLYIKKKTLPEEDFETKGLTKIIANKFYVDEIYDAVFVKPCLKLADFFKTNIEVFIDNAVNGIGAFTYTIGGYIRKVQAGNIGLYLFGMIIGIIVVLVATIR